MTDDMSKAVSWRGGKQDTMYRPYIPYNYKKTIPIQVNLVFLQKDDGTGGFQANNPEHRLLWDDIESKVNAMYTNFSDQEDVLCYAWKDPFLSEAKIRFEFNRIYIKDSYAWNRRNYSNYWGGAGEFQCPPLDYIEYLQTEIETSYPLGINVFFTEDPEIYEVYQYCEHFMNADSILPEVFGGWGCSEFPTDDSHSQIHMPDTYSKFLWMKYIVPIRDTTPWDRSGNRNVWWWEVNSLAASLAHELGHSLDLHHSCNHYSTNQCAHALMHQGNINNEHSHNYLPPTEIGKIHYSLSTTKLKNFVRKDLEPVSTLEISTNLVWDKDFRSYTHIATKSTLTLNDCYLTMPSQSHIDVSGHLYIRNSDVSCVLEDGTWNGIRVKEGGVLWLENTTVSDYDIVMEPGSTLVLKGELNVANNHKIVVGDGCYVCASSDFQVAGSSKSFSRMGNIRSGLKPGTVLLHDNACDASGWTRFCNASSSTPSVLYVQNQQITSNQTFVAKEIVVGSNVTSTKPSGPITIENGAKVTFISQDGTRFEKGFRCEGGSLKVLRSAE